MAGPRPAAPLEWAARVLALVAGVALAFSDVLPAGRGLFFRDHVLVFRHRWWGVVEALSEGRGPALTWASPGGVPLEQMLNATWTPATVLLLLGDFDVLYDLFVAAHYVILGIGALLLARALGAGRDAAFVGAAVATFAGPVVASENLFVMLQGIAWVPWVGLGLTRLFRAPTPLAVAGTALATGFHLQGITPVVMVLDLACAAGLAAHLRPGLHGLGAAVLAGLLGLGVASPELAPALAALANSERGAGFDYAAQSGWALNPGMLVELWIPSFWAPPEHPALNVPAVTGRATDPPYFTTLYLGTALSLAAAGGIAGQARKALWAAFGLALLVAMGRHTPLHGWLVSLPILTSSRYAVKYTLGMAAALVPLAILALPVVARAPKRLLLAALAQAGLLLAAWLVITSPEYLAFLEGALVPVQNGIRFEGVGGADLRAALVEAQEGRTVVALAAALGLGGVALTLDRLGRRGTALIGVVVLMDLALAAAATIHGADLEAKALPPAAEAELDLDGQRHWIEVPSGVNPPVAHVSGVTRFDDMMRSLGRRGHHARSPARLWMDLDLDGLSHPLHHAAHGWVAGAPRPEAYRLMARLGVARILSPRPDLPLPRRLQWPVPGEPPQHLYEVPGVRPYVSAFTRWRRVDPAGLSRARYLALLADPGVGIVTLGPVETSTQAGCPPPEIEVEAGGRTRIAVAARAECPALIVLQEVARPGWTVSVDGAPAPRLEVDSGYLGARIPPGAHRVVFAFEALSRDWGGIAGASILACLGLAALHLRRHRLASASRDASPGASR